VSTPPSSSEGKGGTEFIAIDWSGKKSGAEQFIWLAHVRDRQLVELKNGWSRSQVVDQVAGLAADHERTVVGLDFAFSFPEWYLDERGWTGGPDVWAAMRDEVDRILADCPSPFWGRPDKRNVHGRESFRQTEREVGGTPKSVFQVGGAGAVGTGSLRGMPELAALAESGFWIWPFGAQTWPRVVEIYPRLLTQQVVKSRHRDRLEYLNDRFPTQSDGMRERAAGSEDAFDAAVSALVMAEHASQLEALDAAPAGSPYAREGRIWQPGRID
jgi:hypothetical protein